MRISKLQKFILLQCYDRKNSKLNRDGLSAFYNSAKKKPKTDIQVNSITASIERLINKGLLVGFGEFTQSKNFISQIRLSSSGRKVAKQLLGEQKKLPLKLKKIK